MGFRRTDADILSLADRHSPAIVAMDAPLGLPRGMDCLEEEHPCRSLWDFKGRRADREIIDRGMSIYVITKRTFIKAMVYRAIELAAGLRARGHRVIEVYPYASKVRLFGRPIPRKTGREGLRFLRAGLAPLIGGLEDYSGRVDHDLYDALVAAYTAYLHGAGRTETLGLAEEGQIVLPGDS
jgi:predicted nuclease with RNAse H fold